MSDSVPPANPRDGYTPPQCSLKTLLTGGVNQTRYGDPLTDPAESFNMRTYLLQEVGERKKALDEPYLQKSPNHRAQALQRYAGYVAGSRPGDLPPGDIDVGFKTLRTYMKDPDPGVRLIAVDYYTRMAEKYNMDELDVKEKSRAAQTFRDLMKNPEDKDLDPILGAHGYQTLVETQKLPQEELATGAEALEGLQNHSNETSRQIFHAASQAIADRQGCLPVH